MKYKTAPGKEWNKKQLMAENEIQNSSKQLLAENEIQNSSW